MATSVLHIHIDTSRKVTLEHLQVPGSGGLVHGAVSVHVNVERRHADFEQKPNDFVEAFVTGPVKRRVLADLLSIWGLNERVVLLFLLAIKSGDLVVVVLGLLEVLSVSVVLNKQTHHVLVAVTCGPE